MLRLVNWLFHATSPLLLRYSMVNAETTLAENYKYLLIDIVILVCVARVKNEPYLLLNLLIFFFGLTLYFANKWKYCVLSGGTQRRTLLRHQSEAN